MSTPMKTLNKTIDQLADAKVQLAKAQEEVERLTAETLELMGDVELDSHTTAEGNSATVVSPVRIEIDQTQLKKKLGATVWKSICKTVMDNSLLEDAIAREEIDVTVVASVSTERPAKSYIRMGSPKAKKIPPKKQIRDAMEAQHTDVQVRGPRKKATRGG